MYQATTRGIVVLVQPDYCVERSSPEEDAHFWTYTIEIRNEGTETVQLINRYWHIVDALGKQFEVRGPGVVGEQPTLAPGESFRYTSGVPLTTPSGMMSGSYEMRTAGGETFEAEIPAFSLDCPHGHRSIN